MHFLLKNVHVRAAFHPGLIDREKMTKYCLKAMYELSLTLNSHTLASVTNARSRRTREFPKCFTLTPRPNLRLRLATQFLMRTLPGAGTAARWSS